VFTFVALVFLAGSADRLFLSSGIGYETQIWLFRIAVIVLPPVVYALTKLAARELRDRVSGTPPLG
jgi:ubiquinol-cytochrome c reductase cytochrome b subunit